MPCRTARGPLSLGMKPGEEGRVWELKIMND